MIARLHRTAPLLLVALLAAATLWAVDTKAAPDRVDPEAYRKEVEAWRQERNDGLKKEDGWLTLVGLYWLKPGENRFGSDPGNPVILPQGKAPGVAGSLRVEGETVTVHVEPGLAITADGQKVKTGMALKTDADGKPTVLQLGSLQFHVIKRGDRLGVRIKDRESPLRASFKGLDTYPIQPEWRVVARFEPYKDKTLPIANIVGQVNDIPSPGAVVFDWQGQTYRLDALQGSPEGGLFLIFTDKTSGKETYGAGRYLDTDPPKDSKVVVDFNTAYNPPCAFTAFATCPLPPPQNKLPIAIPAGEKKFAGEPHS
jgi:uncharacterized protein (DUF1684 family)